MLTGEHQHDIADRFNAVADAREYPPLGFFPRCAHRLVELADVSLGERVLDAGTGSGDVAMCAAARVGPTGMVLGIDIAEVMLERARHKIDAAGLTNVELRHVDAAHLPFGDRTFDVVTAGFSILFLPDVLAALREWKRVVTSGGRVALTLYGPNAFEPCYALYRARLDAYGVQLPVDDGFPGGRRLVDPERLRDLVRAAALDPVDIQIEQHGFEMSEAAVWWDMLRHLSFGSFLSRLPPAALRCFQAEHIAEVDALACNGCVKLPIPVIFAVGRA